MTVAMTPEPLTPTDREPGSGPRRNLNRLLEPRTIAVIGGEPAEGAIRQSDRLGFDGDIWPVHPTRQSMAGRPVYRSLGDLPGTPDAAFVAVNRWLTVEAVHELAAMDCGGAVLYASGFAESGKQGAELQRQLTTGHDMPLLGPNCYGIINAVSGATLWPDAHGAGRVKSGPALISQSGNIAVSVTMNIRGLNFSHVVALGNQASVTAEDCLLHFAARDEVTAVGLYLESITDPLAFGRAALACHESRTPVVVLKTGRTEQAERITSSHTAALASPAASYDALFEHYGVIVVETLSEFTTTLAIIGMVGPLPGNRLVSLSCSGGEAALVADRAVHYPVVFEPFTPEHSARVEATLPELVSITNPLDYHSFIWGDVEALERCFTEVLAGPFDAAMLILDWPSSGNDDTNWWPTLGAFEAATRAGGKAGLVVAGLAENLPDRIREYLSKRGLPFASAIDESLGGLAAAAALGPWFDAPPPPLHFPPRALSPPPSPGIDTTLDEPAAKSLLREVGIAVPNGMVLHDCTPAGVSAVLSRLRFPLVAKMVGPAHKAAIGGVVTGIRSAETLATAIRRLGANDRPVLVEEQITGIVAELLLSMRWEPRIGLVMTVGAGGKMVELIADTATLLLPVSNSSICRAFDRLRIGQQLREIRSGPAPGLEAALVVTERLTTLLCDRSDLIEIEVNPLIITSDQAWAVDALVTARAERVKGRAPGDSTSAIPYTLAH